MQRGNPYLHTPTLDELQSALSFENFYVSPVCSPTRAELLTGKYYPKSGVYSTSAGGERINLDQQLLGDYFKERDTEPCFWQMAYWTTVSLPPQRKEGLTSLKWFLFWTSRHYFNARIEHNGKAVRSKGYLTDDLTTKTINLLAKS